MNIPKIQNLKKNSIHHIDLLFNSKLFITSTTFIKKAKQNNRQIRTKYIINSLELRKKYIQHPLFIFLLPANL